MSLTDGNGGLSAADIAAVMGNNSGFGNGWGDGGAWWLLVLFLFAMNGNGWGNGFGGGGNGMMYPFMNANNDVQRGFDQSAVMNGLNGITTALSNGFANAEISRCNANANVLQALNANQSAVNAAMNGLAMSLQNCCCENRAATADLKYTVATEACADRAAVTDGLQQILVAMNAGFQGVHDKLCQQENDALRTENARLQTQINLANLNAGLNGVANRVLADNAAQTVALEQYLNPTPVPAYMVQNPNCCTPNYTGCGCAA